MPKTQTKLNDRNHCSVPKGDLDDKRGLSRVSQTTHKDEFIPVSW